MVVNQKTDIKEKKRAPPSFQHLPRDRALKLKKQWVERQKLKSRWKAQKKREGLDPPVVSPTPAAGPLPSSGDQGAESGAESIRDGSKEKAHRKAVKPRSHLLKESLTHSRVEPSDHVADQDNNGSRDKLSLRELTRRAYSRDSPPTSESKMGPSRKDTRSGSTSRPGLKFSYGSRHGPVSNAPGRSGHKSSHSESRGQPNMKLRMNAMLERIKRDFA